MSNKAAKQIEQMVKSDDLFDELNVTLVELNKAIENCSYMYKTAESLGIFKLAKSSKKLNLQSILGLVKSIDFNQLLIILQSPLVQQIISDPEFLQLFAPDTESTSDTTLDMETETTQQENKE